MNKQIVCVCVELMNYANGLQSRRGVLRCMQALGYSEQTAIFVLELLEDVEPTLQDLDPTETANDSTITQEEPSIHDQAKH